MTAVSATAGSTATEDLYLRASSLMPGGVSSPVRSFAKVGLPPFYASRGEGPRIFDRDGRSFIDYILSWGPLALGHAHPGVVDAVTKAAREGLSFGTCTEREVDLAAVITGALPSVELVRFVSSGTEAVMSAVRVARAATGRDLIVKFDGGYHGHADAFLVSAGSGAATLALPDSPGVPAAATLTRVAPFNDLESVEALFAREGDNIACVVVEPVMGNAGLIRPLEGFLAGLRDICTRRGAVLVFDEVMTGFRVAWGGAQVAFSVRPDLTALGKVIGGGMPVAAYGGRAELMELVAPAGPVYQAGTLSGNPLGMAAGLAQLTELAKPGVQEEMAGSAARLADGLAGAAQSAGVAACTASIGSMWGLFFTEGPVRNFGDAKRSETEMFARFHRACFARGVLLAPSPFEAGFVSSVHTDTDIAETLEAASEALEEACAA